MERNLFSVLSEKIRKEVESDPGVLEKIKQCFSGQLEPFASGTNNIVYQIGKTKTGMNLVLRKTKFDINLETEMEGLDVYCQNAETLAVSRTQGKHQKTGFGFRRSSVSFCVGVLFNKEAVGVITEDMSEGGNYQMTNNMVDYYSQRMKDGTVIDEVLVDLDSCRADGYFEENEIISTTTYFSSENRLEVAL